MTTFDNTTKPPVRTGQQRIEDALANLAAGQARIEHEQRELRERQQVVLLALQLAVPDYAPLPPSEDVEVYR